MPIRTRSIGGAGRRCTLAVDARSIEARDQRLGQPGKDAALALAKRLLDAGTYVDAQMNFHRPGVGGGNGRYSDELLSTGTTPLLRAAVGHDAEAARLLLSYGAEVDLPNIFGITPLLAVSGIATPRGMLSDGTVFPNPISKTWSSKHSKCCWKPVQTSMPW